MTIPTLEYTFKVRFTDNTIVDVIATKANVQNGYLIMLDLNDLVVATYSIGHWVSCTRTSTPESRAKESR